MLKTTKYRMMIIRLNESHNSLQRSFSPCARQNQKQGTTKAKTNKKKYNKFPQNNEKDSVDLRKLLMRMRYDRNEKMNNSDNGRE